MKFNAKSFLDSKQKDEAVQEYLSRRPSIIKKAVENSLNHHIERTVSRILKGYIGNNKKIESFQIETLGKIEKQIEKQIDVHYINKPEIFELQLFKMTEEQIKSLKHYQWQLNERVASAFQKIVNEHVEEALKAELLKNHGEILSALVNESVKRFMKERS